MDQREYRTLILAGLLHDVGKLLNKPDPHGKKHATYGEELLRASPYADLLQDRFGEDVDAEMLRYLVLRHDPYLETDWELAQYEDMLRCIRLADGISAGERSLEKVYGEEARGTRALDPVFSRLDLGRPTPPGTPDYAPAALHPSEAFPAEDIEPLAEEDYATIQESFKTALAHALREADDWRALEAWVYSLLERYTWAVPSAVHLIPRDVSLFDHARTSCAIGAALALYRYSDLPRRRRTFLFIQGDISGVQDYIYTVANVGPGGVAKRLRARSFFVTALTETLSHRLLDDLVPGYRLPVAAKIMAGGGQFVLLAPNLHAVHDRLETIDGEVNEWLWREFQGDLAVVFGTTTAGQKHLAVKPGESRTACDVLNELNRNTEAAKGQRLGAILQDDEGWAEEAFKWEAKAYPDGDCPSCQRLPARAGEGATVDQRLCRRCYQDRLLSERIVGARYIAYYHGAPPQAVSGRDADWLDRSTLSIFDDEATRHVVLLRDLDDLERLDRRPYQLDGFGYETPMPEGPALVRHFANHVPRWDRLDDLAAFCTDERGCVQGSYEDNDTCGIMVRPDPQQSSVESADFPILQTFGCLSAAAAEQVNPDGETFHGAQLLGVLRADVDNLGRLFHRGIGEVKSLSRLATLSRMTDLFFSGWVNETLSNPPEGSGYDRIYTVYAGGDDLCLVGPWDVMIDFTQYMADEFRRYTAGNPNVTLSAAISVTKPKFPIATSARKTGQLLKAAKDAGRNRLNLFGVIARWSEAPDEWIDLSDKRKEQLDAQREHANLPWDELWGWAALLDGELSRWREAETERYPVSLGFAHRLLSYAEMARRWDREQAISAEDMLYLARLSYDLGRNVVTSDAVQEDTKRKLSTLTQLSNRKVMAGMRLPITYALYRNRERSRER
jgi:CRISPR-associated protein Csm1